VTIDGLEFFADAWRRKLDMSTISPTGDRGMALAFLKSKGYTPRSDEIIMQRLVHLTDASKRNELMVIYQEFLPAGMTVADLEPGGKDAAKWPEISESLLTRAKQNMRIEMR
jgi:hypothetical protein